jgi:hypothetical protein
MVGHADADECSSTSGIGPQSRMRSAARAVARIYQLVGHAGNTA